MEGITEGVLKGSHVGTRPSGRITERKVLCSRPKGRESSSAGKSRCPKGGNKFLRKAIGGGSHSFNGEVKGQEKKTRGKKNSKKRKRGRTVIDGGSCSLQTEANGGDPAKRGKTDCARLPPELKHHFLAVFNRKKKW